MNITVSYGTLSITRAFAPGTRITDILTDGTVRARLKMPENVIATIDGRTLDPMDVVSDNDTVLFEKQSASKA